jgi:Lrp/AsnC family leucine-responsive transcriptional regulator
MVRQRTARPPDGRQFETGPLADPVDLAILSELQRDPRIGMSALGRRIGMSPPAVSERVRRLEAAGVIRGYRVELDPAALGFPTAAYDRVRPGPAQLAKIIELAKTLPEVVECHRITGEDCLLLKVHVPTIEQLETVLDRFLLYGQTTSSIVQSSPVPPRALPLPSNDEGGQVRARREPDRP